MISCLCVTNKRPEMLKRAIKCFKSQSFRDTELVILYQGEFGENFSPDTEVAENIRVIPMGSGLTLGELRNEAVGYANGNMIAQWDDDDWYHPDRLAWQISAMRGSGKEICMLTSILMYNEEDGSSFRTVSKVYPGSIVAMKAAVPRYPAMSRSEDTRMARELDGKICELPIAELYIHVFHGGNAMEKSHFERQCIQAGKLSESISGALQGYLK